MTPTQHAMASNVMNRTANQIADDALRAAYVAGMHETLPPFRVTREEFRTLLVQPNEWRNMLGLERVLLDSYPRTICGLPLEIAP